MAKINTKKHKCKDCEKSHTESIGTYMVSTYTYRNHDGNIYIDAFSIFDMFNSMGLTDQANAFMRSISGVRKKKNE